jgi:hypothetical protein
MPDPAGDFFPRYGVVIRDMGGGFCCDDLQGTAVRRGMTTWRGTAIGVAVALPSPP